MAIFRDGVKVGKFDIRTGLTKGRAQGILEKIGIIPPKPNPVRPMGEIDAIRSVVGMGEGFMRPCNFKIQFECPMGIQQPTFEAGTPFSKPGFSPGGMSGRTVKGGSLDWQTHKMQKSTRNEIQALFDSAQPTGKTDYKPFQTTRTETAVSKKFGLDEGGTGPEGGGARLVRKLDLYCSKVQIPELTINTGLYRHYGESFPFPQSVQYGTITTTFYCDGAMTIKKFFDAWQKLIWNDMTGNFNYYDEYVSNFNVFTRSTISRGQVAAGSTVTKKSTPDTFPDNISTMIKDSTKAFDKLTSPPDADPDPRNMIGKVPAIAFANTYGVKVFNCWPQTVGAIDLSHDATDQIGTFDVTWAYTKWNPFKLGSVGNRSEVNLSIGEFRNEKDGFPFLEDLPPELSGPLTGALGQAATTSPMSNLSNLLG